MYFQKIFEEIIPEKQIRIAEDTRALVRRKVGQFSDYELSTTYPDTVKPEIVRRARILGALALQVQWVYGVANKAETSYFKIDQEVAPINKTELFLLQARNKPNALASRAIRRSGTSHKYRSKFPNDKKIHVEEIAKDINSMLFNPPLRTNPISWSEKLINLTCRLHACYIAITFRILSFLDELQTQVVYLQHKSLSLRRVFL
jgi:hypothetical protein